MSRPQTVRLLTQLIQHVPPSDQERVEPRVTEGDYYDEISIRFKDGELLSFSIDDGVSVFLDGRLVAELLPDDVDPGRSAVEIFDQLLRGNVKLTTFRLGRTEIGHRFESFENGKWITLVAQDLTMKAPLVKVATREIRGKL